MESLRYWIDYDHQNEYIDIPEGFEFDFSSVPCFCECFFPRNRYVMSIVHDYLYRLAGEVYILDPQKLSPKFQKLEKYKEGVRMEGDKLRFLYTRKFADILFHDGLIEEGAEILHRDVSREALRAYWGVRLFGASNFRK